VVLSPVEHGYDTTTTTIKQATPSSIDHASKYLFRSLGSIKLIVPEHLFSHFAVRWRKVGPNSRTITSTKVLIRYRCVDHSDDSRNIFVKDTFVPSCQTPVGGSIVIDWNLVDCPAIESASLLVSTDFGQELSYALSISIMLFFDVFHALHTFFSQLTSAIVSRHTR
jgi:hypothetical protein